MCCASTDRAALALREDVTLVRRTSVLENISLSTKSATPSSRVLLSAYAIPTVLVLAALLPAVTGALVILIAMTMGAETISVFTKSRSSTADKLPGEACHAVSVHKAERIARGVHTSLSSTNLVAFFPWPASGTHISTLSCLLVNASLKKVFARLSLRVTLGRPARPPRYLMTELVRKTWVAT